MKILPAVGEYFHADRRTDMMKLLVAFRNPCECSQVFILVTVLFDAMFVVQIEFSGTRNKDAK